MSRIRNRSGLLGLALSVCALVPAGPAVAESSSVETAATLGGRILGAAKACGINPERIRRTSERMVSVLETNASSKWEKAGVRSLMLNGQAAGAEEVRSERSRCHGIHVEFSEMEVKLGRAPVPDGDRVVAKRGIPAIGALKPDPSTRKE